MCDLFATEIISFCNIAPSLFARIVRVLVADIITNYATVIVYAQTFDYVRVVSLVVRRR